VKIVGINGSLRKSSSNGALLRAAQRVVPEGVEVVLYEGLGRLPHFNPDLDLEGAVAPVEVAELRRMLIAADAIVISSPEYAHGVPGALKNMLDWLVATGELVEKPVALLNASPAGGAFAQASLLETLRTMNWRVVEEASLMEPFVGRRIVDELTDEGALETLHVALGALVRSAST
jgi:chromate reductase, NAD(P)H dehydrogenase (quinone)